MAKLTIDEAKKKLEPIAKTIEAMKAAGIEINQILTDEFNRLTKIIEGNVGSKVADWFNTNIASQLNASPEAIEAVAGVVGTKARVSVVIVTAEDGTKTVKFETGSGSAGGQKAGTTSGGTKAATPFNNYHVVVKENNPKFADYAVKEGTFTTAAKAVEFILNGGKNAMNLGAYWQQGNSMVRALVGTDQKSGLLSNKEFTDNYELNCSYVEPVKKEVAPTTETAPTA